MRRRIFLPGPAKDGKRIGADAAHAVVCAAHHEAHAAGNGAELANNKPVAKFRPVEQHVLALKGGRVFRVVVIGIVADLYIRRGNGVL